MRKQTLPWIAALALVLCTPVMGQSPQPPGHMDTPGATYANGTVVSQTSNAIVIRTDNGETRTFLLSNATIGVKDFATGTRVKIDFELDDQGRAEAKQIMGGSEGAGSVATAPTTSAAPVEPVEETPTAAAPVVEPTTPAPTVSAEAEAEVDVDSADEDLDEDTPATTADSDLDGDDELPATASPLALLALLGAGAAAGGLGLRAARKQS